MARKAPSKKSRPSKSTNSPKRGRGRPSDFKLEYCEQAERLCKLLNATDEDLARYFEKDVATINRWKLRYPEFCASLKRGKVLADITVAASLHERAIGVELYEEVAIKVKTVEYSDGKRLREVEDVKIVKVLKRYPPDTTAAIFWLKNRDPQRWRDKHEVAADVRIDVNLDEVRNGIEGKLARIAGAAGKAGVSPKP